MTDISHKYNNMLPTTIKKHGFAFTPPEMTDPNKLLFYHKCSFNFFVLISVSSSIDCHEILLCDRNLLGLYNAVQKFRDFPDKTKINLGPKTCKI